MATSQQALRQRKIFRKVITFTGASGNGAVGTIAVATMTGAIVLNAAAAYCSVDLVGSATIEVGVANDTASILPQATATALDAGMCWAATPDEGVALAVNQAVAGNVILTVGSAAVTAGSIEIFIEYTPLTSNGFLQ